MKLNFYKQTCLVLILTLVSAGLYAQRTGNITLNFRNQKLSDVLQSIERQAGKSFFYDGNLIGDENRTVTISVKNASLGTVVDILFDKRLAVSETSQHIVLRRALPAGNLPAEGTSDGNGPGGGVNPSTPVSRGPQSKLSISGTVVDADNGAPVPYESIVLKGTSRGIISDRDGKFTIVVNNPATDVLTVSFMGYKTQDVKINNRGSVDVRMETDIHEIGAVNVAVTGYQTLSKERATGSFSVITGDELAHKIQPNLTSRMEGMAAGYTSYKGEIRIRGTATLQGDAAPLYVINGLPYEGSLDAINPAEIGNITILKDAAAASIYGARSANGVIVITTRGGIRDETTRVEYNNTFMVTPLRDDRSYLKLMSSAELVDFQKEMFDNYHTAYNSLNKRYYLNEVSQLLYDREAGTITTDAQLENELNKYRNRNNRDQLVDNFLRNVAFAHQHNLSIRGGSGKFTYAASMNYSHNTPSGTFSNTLYDNGYNNERIGYNVKTVYDFYRWLKVDFSMIGSYTKEKNSQGFVAYDHLYGGRASYQMITDEQGRELNWYQSKSQDEIDRLVSLGLKDEGFYPLQEHSREKTDTKTSYFNINVGANFTITDGLTLDLRYQNAKDYTHKALIRSQDAYWIRTKVNDATQIVNGKINHLIPPGGYIEDDRLDGNYYVACGQLNFDRTFNTRHNVTAIAGGEVNAKHTTGTYLEKYGYDPQSLDTKQLDEVLLSDIQYGTESVSGYYVHTGGGYKKNFSDREDRYISVYGNASYTYDMRYSVTGSIKMEQSNLWGTDTRNQYRPFWHVGATWKPSNERFMDGVNWVDFLSLRVTQGVNGQVPKNAGPYLILVSTGLNSWINEYSNQIESPPNSGLKWERTDVTNVGLDFRILNNRLRGSVDWYNKKTKDLLSNISTDPTSGWSSLMMNYASLYNRGIEVSLDSDNLRNDSFRWTTTLNFSYNKNMVTGVDSPQTSVASYVQGNNGWESYLVGTNTREGMPLGTLYSFRWAGLDENGRPQVYKKDGSIAKSMTDVAVEDLVESGTIIPPYSASMTNSFRYKGLNFSFMFIYYGGHKMRDAMGTYITAPQNYNAVRTNAAVNMDRNIMNYWKEPNDSNDPGKNPAVYYNASSNTTHLWYGADKHIRNASYLKLRDITVSYDLPEKLLRKTGMRGFTLHAQVQNIWTWSANGKGLDPEAWSGVYSLSQDIYPERTSPVPTIYSFGLTLKL